MKPYSMSIAGIRVEFRTTKFPSLTPLFAKMPRALTLFRTAFAQFRVCWLAFGLMNISKPFAAGFSAAFLCTDTNKFAPALFAMFARSCRGMNTSVCRV